jgi:hypothetical protein
MWDEKFFDFEIHSWHLRNQLTVPQIYNAAEEILDEHDLRPGHENYAAFRDGLREAGKRYVDAYRLRNGLPPKDWPMK